MASVWSVALAVALGAGPYDAVGGPSFTGAPPAPAGSQPIYAAPPAGSQGYQAAPVYGGGHVHDMGAAGAPVQGGAPVDGVPYGEDYGSGPQGLGYPAVISNGAGEQLYPYDMQDPWLHGYWQEMPAYGGFNHFRPYNYKHVLSQSQAAGGWGLAPTMPYSQQFWHRYEDKAKLNTNLSQSAPKSGSEPVVRTAPAPARRSVPARNRSKTVAPASYLRQPASSPGPRQYRRSIR